jgi:hypothetical protein
MKNGRSARTVSNVLWILLIVSFSQAHAEHLFRWTDDTGRPCYSNISPPAVVKEYSVDTVSYPVSDRSGPVQVPTDFGAKEKMPVETDGAYSDYSTAFLKQRIMDWGASISILEALLRKHPNDPVLRKSLFIKKRYLFDDLTRLENVRR